MAGTRRTTRTWLLILGALWLLFLVAVVVVLLRPPALFGAAEADEEQPVLVATTDPGWFSQGQVDRGGDAFAAQCAHCHGTNLDGGTAPALSGPQFWDRWEGDTVHTFFEVTRQTMPLDAPGSLDDQTYVDITAFVMAFNGFPHEAPQDTPPDEDVLGEMEIDRAIAAEGAIAPDGAVAEAPPPATEVQTTDEEAEEPEEEPVADPTAEVDADETAHAKVDEEPVAAAPGTQPAEPVDPDAAPDAEALGAPDEPMDAVADEDTPAVDEEDEAAVPVVDEDPAEPAEEPAPDEAAPDEAEPEEPAAEEPEPEEPAADEPAPDEPEAEEPRVDEEDGWFTEAQVQAGEGAFQQHCARCHGADLQGFPPLVGPGFPDRFTTVWELYEFTRNTMPLDAPGTLDDQTYADVIAYVLHENGYPVGDERLVRDRARMQEMAFEDVDAEPAEEPNDEEPAPNDDEPAPDREPNDEPDANDDANADANANANDEADADANANADADANDEANAAEAFFTDEQADRGADEYQQHCAHCHGDDLQGQPPLQGEQFLGTWDTVHAVFDYTRETMPQDDPGALDDQTYADIIAFVMRENDFPAGDEELDADDEDAMQDMPFDPQDAEANDATEANGMNDDAAEAEAADAEAAQPEEAREDLAEVQDATELTEPREEGPAVGPEDQLQADRGQHAYMLHCSRCHGETLQGNVAPALGGPVFLERWEGHPVDWLYFFARTSMPPHAPGFLPEQTYADIIVFALTEAGVLEGFEEFRPFDEEFRTLIIRPMEAPEERAAVETRVQRLRDAVHAPHEDDSARDVGAIMPIEWPDDHGAHPIGPPGRMDAPFEAAPGGFVGGDPEDVTPADDDDAPADGEGAEGEPAEGEAADGEADEAADGETAEGEAADGDADEAEEAPELAPADPAPPEDDGDDDAPIGGRTDVHERLAQSYLGA